MTVSSVRAFEVAPGRREEFVGVLGDAKRLFEANGSITRAASTFYGGEATGRITSLNAFTDLGAMADFLQKLQQLEAPNPVAAALESDNPPARMIQASVLDDVTPRPHDTLVTERAVATVLGLRATPGQEAALMDGLAKAQDASEARGGEMRVGASALGRDQHWNAAHGCGLRERSPTRGGGRRASGLERSAATGPDRIRCGADRHDLAVDADRAVAAQRSTQ